MKVGICLRHGVGLLISVIIPVFKPVHQPGQFDLTHSLRSLRLLDLRLSIIAWSGRVWPSWRLSIAWDHHRGVIMI